MGAEIRSEFGGADVSLIEGSGGVFDVRLDGELVYSKDSTGRFPGMGEINGIIREGQR